LYKQINTTLFTCSINENETVSLITYEMVDSTTKQDRTMEKTISLFVTSNELIPIGMYNNGCN